MLTVNKDAALGMFVRADGGNGKAQTIEISDGKVRALPRHWQEMRVLAGKAWLTMNGQDYFLEAGQSLFLLERRDKALVSSFNGGSVRIEVS